MPAITMRLKNLEKDVKTFEVPIGAAPKKGEKDTREVVTMRLGSVVDADKAIEPHPHRTLTQDEYTALIAQPWFRAQKKGDPPGWLDLNRVVIDQPLSV